MRKDDEYLFEEMREIPLPPPTQVVIAPTDTCQQEACNDFPGCALDKSAPIEKITKPPPKVEPETPGLMRKKTMVSQNKKKNGSALNSR